MSANPQTTTLGSDLFIGGQWKQGAAGILENIDPGNGETIGAVTLANQADVQAALDAAADAFLSLNASNIGINQMAPSLPDAPLGGLGNSGYGYEGGSEGVLSFTQLRLISQRALT